ncbi:MAG: hypothetical protein IPP71_16875 [Bacteroidetes bacterium]|nr:hypothetical protein [Bacteroidota bacterium]
MLNGHQELLLVSKQDFGFYVPVTYRKDDVRIGATGRFGPFIQDPLTLRNCLQIQQTQPLIFHAGMRVA